MPNRTFRGVLKEQTLVILDEAAPLPDGTLVEVRPLPAFEPGSPSAIIAAMEAEPHLSAEDVAELETAIAEGRRPPATIDPFGADAQQEPI